MASCGSSTSLVRLDSRLRPFAAALVAAALGLDPTARVTSTYRTRRTQLCLLDAARRGDPSAMRPATHSLHEYGLALDISTSPAVLAQLHRLWQSWGGAPPVSGDPVHFAPRIAPGGLVPEAG